MRPKTLIHIAIADDHVIIRKGVCEIINSFGGFAVDTEASNGEELIKKLQKKEKLPDICIIDINMPVMNGYDTLLNIKKLWPAMKVLVLTMFDNEHTIIKMLTNGANGFILKNSDPKELKKALLTIEEQGYYHAEFMSGRFYATLKSNDSPKITDKEMQFLTLCCSDLNYKEIAERMNLSPRTVEGYRDNLFEKLGVRTRTALMMYAITIGIVPINTVKAEDGKY